MKILVLNCGSSSIKFQLLNMIDESVLAEGIIEKIGEASSLFTYKSEPFTKKKSKEIIEDHAKGLQMIIDTLLHKEHGIIKDAAEIAAVGHRLVHGGEYFTTSVVITKEVEDVLEKCCVLAPLHNPANIKGIEAVHKNLPETVQCGCFDTAFHQTIPAKAYLYPLSLDLYNKYKIRKYGFHGTSHQYVSLKAAEYVKKDISELKIITCHIGNGASVTAIDGGKSIDTSMGFTPLEGLMMGTRCGDLDPAIPIYMNKTLGMSMDEIDNILNKKSGMLGLSQISNDMREIEDEVLKNKNSLAIQALSVYAYRITKYIGAYFASLNGCDLLVFTGGVGEKMPILRQMVLENLDALGIVLDLEKNQIFNDEILDLTAPTSKVRILKVPTNEELMIALETKRLISEN
ncbi:MAG TPA: acetate kinase [Candidatus Cloacimonadota bacterium]|jgi:acetate kinase|nr:acetate kinase [Candidatus Cloacimonadales bacterium]HPY96014.1 acetate kinase [Candidatus Cloacimonadota bacterium]HQB40547.1 acetate kinase [Candidatus Cloacimonadota bacterium]